MEFIIVASLATIGWKLAAKGSSSRRSVQEAAPLLQRQQMYPFDNQVDSAVLLAADTRASREHVGEVYDAENQMYRVQPNVRSDKTAAVDTQRKLEMFTGTEETWKHKSERPPAFKPEESKTPVTFRGTAMTTKDLYDPEGLLRRNVFGTKLNNTLPFEQKRVGPGLGVAAEVPAIDGFHSQFRVLPCEAMNFRRINQLPNRIASGAPVVPFKQQRTPDYFEKHRPSLVDCPPAVTGPMASVQAQTVLTKPLDKPTKSEGISTCSTGAPFVNAGNVVASKQSSKKKQLEAAPSINRRGASGQKTRSQFTTVRTRRDQDMPENTGTARPGAQQYVATKQLRSRKAGELTYDDAMATGTTSVHAKAGIADGCFVLKNTFRELSADVTGRSAVIKAGDSRPCQPSDSGFREMPAINAGECSIFRKDTVRSHFSMGTGREAEGRMQRGSLATSSNCHGTVRRKHLDNAFNRPVSAGRLEFAQQRGDTGRVNVSRKIPSEDPRSLTLGLGAIQECT